MADRCIPDKPKLTRAALRRILVSLIVTEQADRLKAGAIGSELSLARMSRELSADLCDDLVLDEETLGFDSLATLDLILRVNRFFGLHQSGIEDYLLVQRRIGDWIDLIGQHWDLMAGDVALTFATSGSSGPPKHVTHRIAALVTEIDAMCQGPFMDRDPAARIIAMVPPHHIYGFLFTCLLPSCENMAVIDLHNCVPTGAFSKARAGDVIIATPHIWGLLGRSGQRFADGVHGVTSAGPSDAETWAIRQSAGLHRLTEVYGATETGGIGFRTSSDAPFALLGHLIRDDQGLRSGDDRLDLQDSLIWSNAREFVVAGRLDDVVQIAGVNVSPAHVADVISRISGVEDVVVRHDAAQLRAFVVPSTSEPDSGRFEASVRREITAQLDPVARPTELTFGPALPRNAMGKIADWA